jgi:hypothetical protein
MLVQELIKMINFNQNLIKQNNYLPYYIYRPGNLGLDPKVHPGED